MQKSLFEDKKLLIPEWVDKLPQKDQVLFYLENVGSISNMTAFNVLHITQLQGCIRDLRKQFRKEGYKRRIESIPRKGINEFGNACTWVDYELYDNEQFV